ncbi:alpha/beta hydrolase fold protein [Sphaerosporella brunnea]|uniref:Alpha/beta hydrolase fold protein n=1 Tax=Sphaerosporella brunnea TaxID=1250544 RepID=A0A5J5F0Z7_9PEZI|nr:alpha/beta hydrolase fold protein [Sphaerosporella brunnea]
MSTPSGFTSGYAPVNGLSIYYESAGTCNNGSAPLLILHGAFGTLNDFHPLMTALAPHRRVLALEHQAHGRTADIDRPLSHQQLAEDAAAFLTYLNIPQADIFGYSLGGRAAQYLAIRHPLLVRRLVIAASWYAAVGLRPEILKGFWEISMEQMRGTKYEEVYKRLAPDPQGFPRLVEKMRDMNRNMVDIPEEQARGIMAPMFVVVGDSDYVTLEHAIKMFRLSAGPDVSQLAVLPETSHEGIVDRSCWIAGMVEEFLGRV